VISKKGIVNIVGQIDSQQHHSRHCPHGLLAVLIHTYTGGPRVKDNEAIHINNSSAPLSIFLLHLEEIVTLLVVETDCFYLSYSDAFDEGPSAVADPTEAIIFVFLAVTIQMGHCL
jgi:hypothetical protein